MLPLVRRVSGALASWLGTEMDERLELTPDMDAIPALAVEREALWRRVSAAEFLTESEKRAMLGLPPTA